MRIRTTAAALAAVAAITLSGCSSSGSDSATPGSPAAATSDHPAATQAADDGHAALTAAVKAYSTAYFKPDTDAAYALLSARCRAASPQAVYASVVTATAKAYGHQAIKTLTVDQISGDLARVTYTYAVPKLNQTGQPWTREGGTWRYDAC